jgi:hypothetical protein
MQGKRKPELRERGLEIPRQKAAAQRAFSVIPKQYLHKFLKTTRENMRIEKIWFLK